MSSTRLVDFKEIVGMLDTCAPGARIEPKKHRNWVFYNGLIYRGLPLGAHGRRENPEIQIGHVKKMARHLGILDCAKQFLNLS